MTAESQRAQRNCIFPRIPERGIQRKGLSNILKFYTFCQTIVLYFALYVLPVLSGAEGRLSKGSEMQNQYLLSDLCVLAVKS